MKNRILHTALHLTEMITPEQFSRIDAGFAQNYGLGLEFTDTEGREIRSLCSRSCQRAFCRLVRDSKVGSGRCRQDRLRSLNISIETGQPYITLCHAGIGVVCVPVMDGDLPLGGAFFGKCVWEPVDETIREDIRKRLRGLRFGAGALEEAVSRLPVISARRIHEAAEFLYVLLYQMTGLDPQVVQWRRQRSQQQAKISEVIQDSKRFGSEETYPYELECQLIAKVKLGDRTGAKEILNLLLGKILFHNPGHVNLLKARLVELLSVLSRAAAQGGVDINMLLSKNLAYIDTVLTLATQEDLCIWISRALDEFIESVYSSQDAKKISQLRPAMEYMQYHFDQPLTLEDIARQAHLSVSRLSHLFKEQVGITVIEYLTNIRINQAKHRLIAGDRNCTQICFEVGYNNQSYFTRIFKQVVGMTPRQFRQENRRL